MFGLPVTRTWRRPAARSKTSARVAVVATALAVACSGSAHAAVDPVPAPQPVVQFRPANVPWPLSIARARKAARAKAIRLWGARKPRVVGVHRVSYSRVDCRVTWRGEAGEMRARTVKVTRTSAYGVR